MRKPFAGRNGGRGVALIEFALILPILIILVLATVDFGRLIQARLIISNVSREGGSIASRLPTVDSGIITMLKESGMPLNLTGTDGKIIITRVKAGSADSLPRIVSQCEDGHLPGRISTIGAVGANPNLVEAIYKHLPYNATNKIADIPEVTVVEVFYKYRPITPVPSGFLGNLFLPDRDGMIVWSRAIF
jgi:hypothetical protein